MPLGLIGEPPSDQPRDHGDHCGNMLGCPRLGRRRQHAEGGDVLMKLPGRRLGQLTDRHALLGRPGVDLVVDIGDVANIGDVVVAIEMAQQAEQEIEHDHRAGIADMSPVIDRRAAHIEPHIPQIEA